MSRLHVPHPRLADRFLACVHQGLLEGAFDHLRHPKPPVAHTDPAVVADWASWLTPDEWEHRHNGTGER